MVINFKSIFFAPAKEETFWPEKRKRGDMMKNALPNVFFPPTYSPEKVRFPGTIWKQNGNSLQYEKGFCNKTEFLTA